ncbi:MAG TPA: OsmC family protein [Rubricoccaceae bacterium]|nr:OsmC family protein [Rubricoccaceae bacterium]
MKITARIRNRRGHHEVVLQTAGAEPHALPIAPKPGGQGSSVNGGELLLLALATCYCNDVYREAARRGIEVEHVEVEVEGTFGAEGEPLQRATYHASVAARASEDEIRALLAHTDTVAEVQNTLRAGCAVTLGQVTVQAV